MDFTRVSENLKARGYAVSCFATAQEAADYLNGAIDGVSVAQTLGQPPEQVFKTLVTKGASGAYYVFDIPVAENLDLKKAAKAVGEKSVAMLPQKELLPLTGYVRRLLPGGHEEAVPHGVPRDGTAVRHGVRLRRKDRSSGGVRPQRAYRPPAGKDSGCDRVIRPCCSEPVRTPAWESVFR